ncbi:MAG: hypothetical protein WBN30_10315 [Polyangiales bacterium]
MDRAKGPPAAEHIEVDHPWFSNDLMPLYRWTFPSEATAEELRACLEAREQWVSHVHYHFAWVIDMSKITVAPALQRKAVAQHLKRFSRYGALYNAASAIIVPRPWLRGVVTAVTWRSPPKFPYQLFSESIEAERWAKKQLARKRAERDGSHPT